MTINNNAGRDNSALDGNNSKKFLVKATKLKTAVLELAQQGEAGLDRAGRREEETLVPRELMPLLLAAEELNVVVDGTMGDRLIPHYRELLAAYGDTLTSVLHYAKEELGQKTKTGVTWKEHMLIVHFPSWLAKRNDGTLEPGTVRVEAEMRGAAAYAEQTGESCHAFFDMLVWRNFKLQDDNPR